MPNHLSIFTLAASEEFTQVKEARIPTLLSPQPKCIFLCYEMDSGPHCRLWLELLLLPGTDSLLPNSTSQKASHIVIQPNNFTLPGGSLIPVEYSCTRLTLFLLLIVLILIQMFDLPPSSLFLKVILHNSIKSVVGRPPRRIIAIRPCLLQEGLQKFFAAHPINKC